MGYLLASSPRKPRLQPRVVAPPSESQSKSRVITLGRMEVTKRMTNRVLKGLSR